MGRKSMKIWLGLAAITLFWTVNLTAGQTKCLPSDEAANLIRKINYPTSAGDDENKTLRGELLKLRNESNEIARKLAESEYQDSKILSISKNLNEKITFRLCEMIRENGWLNEKLVGEEGVAVVMILLQNSSFEVQKEILPVILAALEKNMVAKPDFASFFDRLRILGGQTQLFGTQASIVEGLLVLGPLENEEKVDDWRSRFDLPPLSQYLRQLELYYQMPLVKSPPRMTLRAESNKTLFPVWLYLGSDNDEPIRIESSLSSSKFGQF